MKITKLRGNTKIGNNLFIVGFVAYVLMRFYRISSIPNMINLPFIIKEALPYSIFYICMLAKILFIDKLSIKQYMLFSIFLVYTLINYYICGLYVEPIIYFLFLFAGQNISYKKIIKIWTAIILPLYLLMIFFYIIGITKTSDYLLDNGRIRRTMGFIYPTVFGSITYYLFLSLSFLTKKHSLLYCIAAIIIAILIFLTSHVRTASATIIMTMILFICFSNIKQLSSRKFLITISFAMIIICALVFFIAIFYDSNNILLYKLNILLSHRLELSHSAFMNFKLSLFGNKLVEMHGVPDMDYYKSSGKTYFYLDSQYLFIAFRFGVIALTLLLIGYTRASYKAALQDDWKIPVIVLLIAIESAVEDASIDLAFNPFISLLLLAIYNEPQLMRDTNRSCYER